MRVRCRVWNYPVGFTPTAAPSPIRTERGSTPEPFERGFGMTVGNSLRRISPLQPRKVGAITRVKIQACGTRFRPSPALSKT